MLGQLASARTAYSSWQRTIKYPAHKGGSNRLITKGRQVSGFSVGGCALVKLTWLAETASHAPKRLSWSIICAMLHTF